MLAEIRSTSKQTIIDVHLAPATSIPGGSGVPTRIVIAERRNGSVKATDVTIAVRDGERTHPIRYSNDPEKLVLKTVAPLYDLPAFALEAVHSALGLELGPLSLASTLR
jgi:hypothetical protein